MELLDLFTQYLRNTGTAELRVKGYSADLAIFAGWFEEAREENFSPANIAAMDLRDYQSYLLTVKGYSTSTVEGQRFHPSRVKYSKLDTTTTRI